MAIFTSGGPARNTFERSLIITTWSDIPGMYAPPAVELPNTSAMVGMPGGRQPGQVAEHLTAGDEDLLLGRQVGAAGFHQRDHRQPVLERDLVGAQNLFAASTDCWYRP